MTGPMQDVSTRVEACEHFRRYDAGMPLEIEAWLRNRISPPPLS
jgi:hypothetical protein